MSLKNIQRVLLVLSFAGGSVCGSGDLASGSGLSPNDSVMQTVQAIMIANAVRGQQSEQPPVVQQVQNSGPSRMQGLVFLRSKVAELGSSDSLNLHGLRTSLASDKQDVARSAEEILLECEAQLGTLVTKDNLEQWIFAQVTACKTELDQSRSLSSKSGNSDLFSQAIVKGLAGHNGHFLFHNIRPDTTVLGAVGAGLTFRTVAVFGDEFEKLLRQEGGPLVDAVVGKPMRGIGARIKKIWNWLFHGGACSYTLEQVAHWKTEVLEVILKGLADHANKAQYDQGNGFGAQARVQRFDDFDDAGTHDEQAPEVPGDVTWMKFVDGLARDLDRLTIRIEVPKKFYSPSDDEDEALMASDGRLDLLDTATRIQEVLQFIKEHILVPTRTLKDLAAGDLKFLVPRLTSEISARFSLFESMVRQYHGIHVKPVPAETSTSRKDGASRSGYAGGGYSSYDQQGGY